MSSFSQKAKQEVLKQEITNDCCAFAFLSGIIKGSGVLRNGSVEIYTELSNLFEVVNKIVEQYYGVSCQQVSIKDYMALKIIRYKITIPKSVSQELLKDISITKMSDKNEIIETSGIDHHIIKSECCKLSYIKGVFVASATSNIVIKNYDNEQKNNTSGYHFEFVFNSEELANDLIVLLNEFNLPSKLTTRKGSFIVYIKEYQLICDLLALMGANVAVLNLQNEAAIREVRNNVNRQINCFNANLSKMVNSSLRHLQAIEYIQNTMGLESLDESLMELALLRIANPDEPLEKLRQLYSYNISKSGINHRLEKIIKIANKLKEEKEK